MHSVEAISFTNMNSMEQALLVNALLPKQEFNRANLVATKSSTNHRRAEKNVSVASNANRTNSAIRK